MIALADVAQLIKEFDSQLERDWWGIGAAIVGGLLEQKVAASYYHPLTFHLVGESYTPDFLHLLANGWQVFVECKGSTKQRGYRDARSKLRAAAKLYPFYIFFEARGERARGAIRWDLERI